MIIAQITSAGFVRPDIDEIKTDLKALIISLSSKPAINFEPEEFFGFQVELLATLADRKNAQLGALYYSRFIKYATGINLDRVADPIPRLDAIAATVTLNFTGTDTTIIPAGTVFETVEKKRYALNNSQTITGGVASGTATAVVAGINSNAPTGSITYIPDPIDGLDTVTNPTAAIGGAEIETDAAFRARLYVILSTEQTSSLNSCINAVQAVANVSEVFGKEYTGPGYTVDGDPPGSVEMIVRGGTDADIAQAIFEAKGAGIETWGTEVVIVNDILGDPHTVRFARITLINSYITVNITGSASTYDPDYDTVIKQAVLDYIGGVNPSAIESTGLTAGESAYSWAVVAALPTNIPGVTGITVTLQKEGGPTGQTQIDVSDYEEFTTDFDKITLNKTLT